MPSPIAHSITGYVLFKQSLERDQALQKALPRQALWVLAIFTANAADLDFIPYVAAGVDTHRGLTHSLVFGICFSLIIVTVLYFCYKLSWKTLFLFIAGIYGSHLLLDFFTAGGDGMQLFWPFSQRFIRSAISLFPSVPHSEGIFYLGHFVFITYELMYAFLLMRVTRN